MENIGCCRSPAAVGGSDQAVAGRCVQGHPADLPPPALPTGVSSYLPFSNLRYLLNFLVTDFGISDVLGRDWVTRWRFFLKVFKIKLVPVLSVNQCCGTVTIYYGSGSGSDFWKVRVTVPFPVPTFEKLWFRFRFLFLLLKKLRFRFRFQLHI